MISSSIRRGVLFLLCLVTISFAAYAQPTLPDIIGDEENGIVLLSWTCQYDGVKSISVMRSADSSFNYSTIGYVKKLYKGVQAFADGHPMPGKNYYKLSIVFNSGLTWGSLHYGVYVDSIAVRKGRGLPSNEALQKLIVTEQPKPEKQSGKVKNAVNPADKDRYMEVYKKEPAPQPVAQTPADTPQQKLKFPKHNDDEEEVTVEDYIETLPVETRKKIAVTYTDDTGDIDADAYIDVKKPTEPQKKVNVTFDDKTDVAGFVATLPKSETRKFTVSYNTDSTEPDASKYIEDPKKPEHHKPVEEPKKVTVTLKDEAAVKAYVDSLPTSAKSKITVSYNVDSTSNNARTLAEAVKKEPAAPRQKISIKFTDDMNVNEAADVKSKYIFNDAVSGNVTFNLPDDLAAHHYSIKFYDKDNHVVIEIPRINTAKVILDKRNFQKKGQYRFALRRDVVELESGYVTIY